MEYDDKEISEMNDQAEERGEELGYNKGIDDAMQVVSQRQYRGCTCSMCIDMDEMAKEIENLKK